MKRGKEKFKNLGTILQMFKWSLSLSLSLSLSECGGKHELRRNDAKKKCLFIAYLLCDFSLSAGAFSHIIFLASVKVHSLHHLATISCLVLSMYAPFLQFFLMCFTRTQTKQMPHKVRIHLWKNFSTSFNKNIFSHNLKNIQEFMNREKKKEWKKWMKNCS